MCDVILLNPAEHPHFLFHPFQCSAPCSQKSHTAMILLMSYLKTFHASELYNHVGVRFIYNISMSNFSHRVLCKILPNGINWIERIFIFVDLSVANIRVQILEIWNTLDCFVTNENEVFAEETLYFLRSCRFAEIISVQLLYWTHNTILTAAYLHLHNIIKDFSRKYWSIKIFRLQLHFMHILYILI